MLKFRFHSVVAVTQRQTFATWWVRKKTGTMWPQRSTGHDETSKTIEHRGHWAPAIMGNLEENRLGLCGGRGCKCMHPLHGVMSSPQDLKKKRYHVAV